MYQPEALGISQELREQGYGLMCVGYPSTDLVIETVSEDEIYDLQVRRAHLFFYFCLSSVSSGLCHGGLQVRTTLRICYLWRAAWRLVVAVVQIRCRLPRLACIVAISGLHVRIQPAVAFGLVARHSFRMCAKCANFPDTSDRVTNLLLRCTASRPQFGRYFAEQALDPNNKDTIERDDFALEFANMDE